MENQRNNNLEVADIFRQFSGDYQREHSLCPSQQKAYRAIIHCRTSALGIHQSTCDHCGHKRISYNSCRNRHCPKCQYIKQLLWVDKLKSKLLPTRYFHIVFTVPEFLNRLFYINQRSCYDMLFKATAHALQRSAGNPAISQYAGLPMLEVLCLVTGRDLLQCPECKTGKMITCPKPPISDGG